MTSKHGMVASQVMIRCLIFLRQTTSAEQEAYVAESLNRALDEMESHKKNGTKPMDARDLLI